MARELPGNQIRPAAQPVAFFLEPTRRQLAAPAGPLEIPRAPGIEVIQQGSGGNVQGFNAFEQVAQALAPFSQRLTELTGFTPATPVARGVAAFVDWYSHQHRHSGIKFLTPQQHYCGQSVGISQHRVPDYGQASQLHPRHWRHP
jgi:hypothetical protein